MTRSRRSVCVWIAGAALLAGPASLARAGDGPAPIIVRGDERILWDQPGDSRSLEFRVYVDGRQTGGVATSCVDAGEELTCSSPLPFLADGVHTITITAFSRITEFESQPSEPILVEKLSAEAPVDAGALSRSRRRAAATSAAQSTSDPTAGPATDTSMAIDILARGIKAPADLVATGDGRLLVAEADGTVRMIRPGSEINPGLIFDGAVALDARTLLDAPQAPLGIAVHPEFARTHFVYVGFLTRSPDDERGMRIVRLREVADVLGEPATIFEAALTITASDDTPMPIDAPRLAFGPDGDLYVALPAGATFHARPGTSEPVASMIRLRDDGATVETSALARVHGDVRGFDWDPVRADLWALVHEGDAIVLHRLGAAGTRDTVGGEGDERLVLTDTPVARGAGALMLSSTNGNSRAVALVPRGRTLGVIGLGAALHIDASIDAGLGQIGDIVAGADGTIYLVTRNHDWVTGATSDEAVVRLQPRPRE